MTTRTYEVRETNRRYRFGLFLTGPCVGGYAPLEPGRDPHAEFAGEDRAEAAGRYFVLTGVTPAHQPVDVFAALADLDRVAA